MAGDGERDKAAVGCLVLLLALIIIGFVLLKRGG